MTADLDPLVAAWEARPADPDGLTERMARAMWAAAVDDEFTVEDWQQLITEADRDHYRRMAVAALQVVKAPAGDPHAAEKPWPDAVLVEGDWVSPSREEHARDLTKSWADAARNVGCPSSFVARLDSFVAVHDRLLAAALSGGAR